MTSMLVAILLLQSPLPLRTELDRPTLPQSAKAAKDYDKLWKAFVAGANDTKTLEEADKLLKKEKTLEPAISTIKAYIDLYRNNSAGAERHFETVLSLAPQDPIALRFLGDLAFAREDYARAGVMYGRLQDAKESLRGEVEPIRQKSILLAAENVFSLTAAAVPPADTAPVDVSAETIRRDAELEDLGRWGADIQRFRKIQAASALTREEFAVLVMRYFPELIEFRQNPKELTDIQDSWAAIEIQTLVGLKIADLRGDGAFHPTEPLTRGDLCRSLAALAQILGVFAGEAQPQPLPDVASGDPLLRDALWALGSGLLAADEAGKFRPHSEVSGREAVNAVVLLADKSRQKGN